VETAVTFTRRSYVMWVLVERHLRKGNKVLDMAGPRSTRRRTQQDNMAMAGHLGPFHFREVKVRPRATIQLF
jgi:hypothetical protein